MANHRLIDRIFKRFLRFSPSRVSQFSHIAMANHQIKTRCELYPFVVQNRLATFILSPLVAFDWPYKSLIRDVSNEKPDYLKLSSVFSLISLLRFFYIKNYKKTHHERSFPFLHFLAQITCINSSSQCLVEFECFILAHEHTRSQKGQSVI